MHDLQIDHVIVVNSNLDEVNDHLRCGYVLLGQRPTADFWECLLGYPKPASRTVTHDDVREVLHELHEHLFDEAPAEPHVTTLCVLCQAYEVIVWQSGRRREAVETLRQLTRDIKQAAAAYNPENAVTIAMEAIREAVLSVTRSPDVAQAVVDKLRGDGSFYAPHLAERKTDDHT